MHARKQELIKSISSEIKLYTPPKLDAERRVEGSSYTMSQLFLFSNESNFCNTLNRIENIDPIEAKLSVAMVVGESHILSILPEIAKHANIVVLNDIDIKIHWHISHLIQCLSETTTPEEFLKRYFIENPLEKIDILKDATTIGKLERSDILPRLNNGKTLLKDKFFLSSQERFTECKNALLKLDFVYAIVDFFNEDSCKIFADILKKNDAEVTLINASNLHDYNNQGVLQKTIPILLQDSQRPLVLYSTGGIAPSNNTLTSCISIKLDEYLSFISNAKQLNTVQFAKAQMKTYLNLYDKKRGLIREITRNSDAMIKLKRISLEDNNDASFSPNSIEEIKKTIKKHMTTQRNAVENQSLTTRILKNIELDLNCETTFRKLAPRISLNILSFLRKKEIIAIGQANSEFYHLSRLQTHDKKQLWQSPSAKTRNIDPILTAILLQLTQYKISREKTETFKVFFDDIFDKHITRLRKFKLFIQNFSTFISADSFALDKTQELMFMLSDINNNRKFFDKIIPEYQSSSSYLDFIFDVNPKEKQLAVDLIFLYRFALELNYAVKASNDSYQKTLENIYHIYRSNMNMTDFLGFYEKQIAAAMKKIATYKSPDFWNLCLVWSGYDGFSEYKIENPSDAKSRYTNGRYVVTETRFTGYVTGGSSEFGSVSYPCYETTERVIRAGIDSDLKYFYTYRERVAIFEEMITTLESFMKNGVDSKNSLIKKSRQ